MNSAPVNLTYDGQNIASLSGVTCGHCSNFFFIVGKQEFAPNFCAYCGKPLKFYDEHNGGPLRKLNGQPIDGGET